MSAQKLAWRSALVAALLLTFAVAVPESPAPGASPQRAHRAAPRFESGSGVTVHGVRHVGRRQYVVGISTPLIDARAIRGRHQVRVILPRGYRRRGNRVRYPVLYLLHGGGGERSSQWVRQGDVLDITRRKKLITVLPEGGKVGWYTNWRRPHGMRQDWRAFHLRHLIPWIDGNLRTIDARRGRAIAGLSMGGFGAISYAEARPRMFRYAASFSGALDLGSPAVRAVITEEAFRTAGRPFGPFGPPVWPADKGYRASNPLHKVKRLRGVRVALYAGSGRSDLDFIERSVSATTTRMHKALDAAGIPHRYRMYGRPKPGELPYNCDGGHNFSCWNYALQDVLPRMLAVLSKPIRDKDGPVGDRPGQPYEEAT